MLSDVDHLGELSDINPLGLRPFIGIDIWYSVIGFLSQRYFRFCLVSVANILHFNQKPVGQYETNLTGMGIGLSSY